MSEVVLGSFPVAGADRDAIHVAVIPVRAAEMLRPGQRVGFCQDGSAGHATPVVGIVDPFLLDVVPRGEWFWLMLLPGSVTGMRHHWHSDLVPERVVRGGALVVADAEPATPATSAPSVPVLSAEQLFESIRWLQGAADRLGVRYEDLISEDWGPANGEYINHGYDIQDTWYEMRDEFWKHLKVVTGREVPEDREGGFTCSC